MGMSMMLLCVYKGILLYNINNHIFDKTQSFSNYQEKRLDKYIHHNSAHIDSTDAKNCPTVTVQ